MRNLITDVPGVRVGHIDDARLASGTTVVLFDEPAVGGMAAPAGRIPGFAGIPRSSFN